MANRTGNWSSRSLDQFIAGEDAAAAAASDRHRRHVVVVVLLPSFIIVISLPEVKLLQFSRTAFCLLGNRVEVKVCDKIPGSPTQ